MKRKYLVSVPIMARVEVYVDAESEEEARELACGKAEYNIKDIYEDTIEPVYFDNSVEDIEIDLHEFAIKEGYYVFDCKKEFGEDFE
jgi:DNA-dependent RNA polymerase auxiliary subunit epsilon